MTRLWVPALAGMSGIVLSLALAACVPIAPLPRGPVAYGPAIEVAAQPVPLNPQDPRQDRVGRFVYAGGVALTSDQTSRLHGLSDLKVWPDGRLLAMGDESDLLQARLVLDAQGRLVGLADARLSAVRDAEGVDLHARGDREADAEGIAEFANGDRLVSYEQHDRIVLYPHAGPPRPAPSPQVAFAFNKGMEALAADPAVAPDAYRVGVEGTGALFRCRLSTRCEPAGAVDLEGLQLSGMDILPGGRTAYLLRDYRAGVGNIIHLNIFDAQGRRLDQLELKAPLTVDNMEGVAAVARPEGAVRFYLLSDDNFGTYNGVPTHQKTLLMAFDWTPPPGS